MGKFLLACLVIWIAGGSWLTVYHRNHPTERISE